MKTKIKMLTGILLLIVTVTLTTGCGNEANYENNYNSDVSIKVNNTYSSELIEGINTRNIKSINLQTEPTSNLSGFSIGLYGTISGGSKIESYYSVYEEVSGGGYALKTYPASNTIIKEIDEGEPHISEIKKYVLIDKESIDLIRKTHSLYTYLLKSNSIIVNVDEDKIYYSASEGKYILSNSRQRFADINKYKYNLNDDSKEKLISKFPEVMEDDKILLSTDAINYILNVPKGTIITEYNVQN